MCSCATGHDECVALSGGAFRWVWRGGFERKASDLRGEVKNHLDRSNFSVGAGSIRARIWRRRGIAASSAASGAMAPR